MKLHEYKNGMTVMDGGRSIVVARDRGPNGWLLTHYVGCWVPRRKFPNLLKVKTRNEARKILGELLK